MKTLIDCPQCDDELEFDVSSDYQGDGVWGQVVEFVELTEKKCDCAISDETMNLLYVEASERVSDHDPANDIDY